MAVSVEVSRAPGWQIHQPMVTHATCASSQVRHLSDQPRDDPAAPAQAVQGTQALALRPPWAAPPAAMVSWQVTGRLLVWSAAPGLATSVTDQTSQVLAELGLWVVHDPADLERLPVAGGWQLQYSRTQFTLLSGDGQAVCGGRLGPAAADWQRAVALEGRCLALAGVGLGLGRPDHQRHLRAATAEGRVGAAVVTCQPDDS